jgi:hypothetical protein
MYEQHHQPNYATHPNFAAPPHIVGGRKQVDWRLMGSYVIAGLGVAAACVCLWLLASFKQVYASQMTKVNHAVTSVQTAQSKNTKSVSGLVDQISSAEAQLALIAPYSMVCQQYLTGPKGGPETFSFPCTDNKSGS